MIEFTFPMDCKNNFFTGVCKVLVDNSIRHYKNGNLHREDGPAYEFVNSKSWWYKDKCYGVDNDFTIKSWKQKVKKIKREEELKIFI